MAEHWCAHLCVSAYMLLQRDFNTKIMKKLYSQLFILFLFISFISLPETTYGQGCVAIRSASGCSMNGAGSAILMPGESQVGANFRYFQSFRHFRGREEEKERVENGTQVINDSYFLDFSWTYAFADRFYASITVPFVYHERSSMYEHGGNDLRERHKTYAKGLSDIRLSAGYWLLSPEKNPKRNLAFGLGVKLPTGDYDATGKFYNAGPDGDILIRPVDQSIQPGDGGFGATVELQGYQQLGQKFILNTYLYYLSNPREDNGTKRRPGSLAYAAPDQYAARLGVNYLSPVRGLDLYLGGRLEGVPVYDLIGGSEAYRRPGYAVSVEPGLTWMLKNVLINLSVPVAVERNRTQSYEDKKREQDTGRPRHGDAAFADYLINLGVSYRLPAKKTSSDVFNSAH